MERYNLTEVPTKDYADCTRQNILDSDGTVIYSHGELGGQSKLTADMATELRRPFLHIDLQKELIAGAAKVLSVWTELHKIAVLNVTGPTASEDPQIYEKVKTVMEVALVLLRGQKRWQAMESGHPTH